MNFLLRHVVRFLCFQNVASFMVPGPLLGDWSAHPSSSVFRVENNNIQALYGGGIVCMSIKNGTYNETTTQLCLMDLSVPKIPKSVSVVNMVKAISFIRSAQKNGLYLIIRHPHAETENKVEVYYVTGKFKGNLNFQRILTEDVNSSDST